MTEAEAEADFTSLYNFSYVLPNGKFRGLKCIRNEPMSKTKSNQLPEQERILRAEFQNEHHVRERLNVVLT